jgi:hypothetical protein
MNQQGQDFFSSRIQADIPKRMVPTSTWTVQKCPVCLKWARTLVRPPFNEFQSEICVDFCGADRLYPNAYVSFKGSWLQDGNAVVETLRGADGAIGPQGPKGENGKDAPPPRREELVVLLKEVLREQGFWRLLRGRIK